MRALRAVVCCACADTAELYPVAFNYGKTTERWIGDWLEDRVKKEKVSEDREGGCVYVNATNPNPTFPPP